jgi:hypothetical protein
MKNIAEAPVAEQKIEYSQPINIEDLQSEVFELRNKVAGLTALVKYYEEQIRLSKHRQFGRSSEKTVIEGQLGLFDEAENTADPKAPEEVRIDDTGLNNAASSDAGLNETGHDGAGPDEARYEEITYTRKKRAGKRADDLSKLPVVTVVYELPESERICPECGGPLHSMSVEERCEVEIIPVQFMAKRHLQHIYSCRNCERNNDHVQIIKAAVPEPVIKGSLASPSAVAHIMIEKYYLTVLSKAS